MKIQDATRPTASARRHEAANSAADQTFGRALVSGGRAPAGAPPTAPLTALGAVLALQEVQDASQGRRRAVRRGRELLDELDGLRDALIDGVLPEAALRRLATLVDARRPAVDDPALAVVLDEIDLRAAVEVAKLERRDE